MTSYSGGRHLKVQLCAAQVTNCECSRLMGPLVNWRGNGKRLEDWKLMTFQGDADAVHHVAPCG